MALEVRDLVAKYGEVSALRGISFTAEDGELTTLVDSNEAGRSTLLETISRLLKPTAGNITPDNREIRGMKTDEIVTLGTSQCPEGREVFQNQMVYKSLEMGAFTRENNGVRAGIESHSSTFPRLRERYNQPAGSLSDGER